LNYATLASVVLSVVGYDLPIISQIRAPRPRPLCAPKPTFLASRLKLARFNVSSAYEKHIHKKPDDHHNADHNFDHERTHRADR
jgi:hypothetical protein